jgi:hypothetical protein
LGKEAYGGLQFDNFWVIGFLDCKFDETCHPGSGPVEDRQLAPRHENADVLQESMYSGYDKLEVFLNLSGLNAHLRALQPEIVAARECREQVLYFTLYSDSIFPILECITRSHRPPYVEK